MKVLVATQKPFAPVAVKGIEEIVKKAGYEFALLEKYAEKAELLEAVKDVNAIIIRSDKIDEEVFEHAPELKIVVRAGAGFDNVDLAAATKHGVVVMNTPGQNSNAVAELVFGMLLYTVRNRFNGKAGTELMGKKLGLLAFGNVPQNVARVAKGLGMDIYAFDGYIPAEVFTQHGVKQVNTPAELFKECDVVSLHIPSTPETRRSINKELLLSMPKGGIVVNTARQDIIDEDGLIEALLERTDLRYVSDLMLEKHDEAVDKLGDRYFATPKKMGAQTAEANINAGLAAANQIVGFFKDGITKFQVNK
ncbi:NAD(P)-dependent oxidoreductase [Alloprevotella tannerae]|jgi:D-phosphoglycerate dehydrogenase|uniref:NAD(P)-dependent oxidoreductase n=1 Tax=Alloprevotella tannerae TaxID=76122 RepID=UPI002889F9F5|nr:NAD(P)-dependent oxidoreductase [Alloprevotella tannerae]